MADFRLKVIADTQAAERGLKQVGEVADKATKTRSLDIKVPSLHEVTKTFQTLERDVKSAANTINTFYKVGKALPGNFGESVRAIDDIGKGAVKSAIALNNNNTAAEIFGNTIKGATDAAGQLVTTLAKVGLATFAIKETVGVLQAAFNGFFNNTIGREIKLRETILKTQTTLASTNKVFKDGKEITDPYQKIVTLTGAVRKNIDSIRERSIALAGVTSGEVIEVFGMVASQVGQIGGGLKEAEDLAINFAAALGTFGIPLYQARQEIGSILRGDITTDSYLAKALGITNEDIAKAKTQTGGVVKFLEERLAAAVAGQKIAAQGFSGVVSNIRDLSELIGQNFGSGLLDPLLNGLTAVFETLFSIRKQIFDIASKAGETVGRVGTLVVGLTAGRTGAGKGVDAGEAATAASGLANKAFTEIESVAQRTVGAIATVINSLKPTALILADAFSNVVEAFLQIKVGTFEALASALANLATAAGLIAPIFASIFNLYARFLNTPIVQYFAEVTTVLALLKRAGLDAATSLLLFGRFIISSVIPALGVLGTAAGAVVGGIAAIGLAIGKLVLVLAGLASALVTPAAAIPAVAAAFKALSASLTDVGNQAVGANTKLAGLGKGLSTLGATAKAAGMAILSSLGWIFAFQVGLAVVIDAFGRFQRVQEDQKASARASEALRRLQTTYKDVGDNANSATKAARDFELAIVNAEYDKALNRLNDIREELNDLRYEAKLGIQTWGEFLQIFDLRRTLQRAQGLNPDSINAAKLVAEEFRLREEQSKRNAVRDSKLAGEKIALEAEKRVNLTKEIADLERSHADKLFQTRQQAASKEVEVFRAAGELRIFQMEQANKKLIEGEEGASAAALEALNTYLATRERGELDIEASKKSLAIEIISLERSVMDYKLDMEKKIAEIRKRSNENDVKTADYRKQQLVAGGATGAAGSGDSIEAAVAATKNLTGVNNQCAEAVKRFMTVIGVNSSVMDKAAKSAEKMGTVMTDWSKLQPGDIVARGSKGDPEHVGVYTGGQNVFHQSGRRGLKTGNYPDLGYFKERGYFVRPSGMAASATPVAPPDLKGNSDISSASTYAKEYAGALKQVTSGMERLRVVQKALTDAKTAADFQVIAKAAFPKVQLEGYRNEIIKAEESLKKLAGTTADAYDPEKLQIQADLQAKIKIADLEKEEILKKAKANQKVTQKELAAIEKQLQEKREQTIIDLTKEASLREEILKKQRQQKAIEDLLKASKDIGFNTQRESIAIQGRMAGAYAGNDPAAARRIQAEVDIANKRTELEQLGLSAADVAAQLQEFANKTRAAAEQLAKLEIDAKAFQEKMAMLNEAVQTIIGAQKTAIKSILKGGDIKEAVQTMANSMADKFLDMTLDAIFKPLEKQMTDQLKKLFGIEDPAEKLQAENNTALQSNTQALQLVASSLSGGSVGGSSTGGKLGNVFQGAETIGSLFQPKTVANKDSSFTSAFSGAQVQAIAMQAYSTPGLNFGSMGNTSFNFSAAADKAEKDTKKTNDNLSKLLGGIGGFAMGIMSIYSGIQSMKNGDGGASGTLIGIGSILSGIGGMIGGLGAAGLFGKKAGGGPVTSGRPYLIGEMGPEMFVPNTGGTVVPTSNLRAAMGRESGTAMGTPILNMSFESTTINGVEYVSRDQLEAAMAQTRKQATNDGARRGMNMTIDRLQQSPNTRQRVGMR